MSGIGLGLNLNRYLSAELAIDLWQKQMRDPKLGGDPLGEESSSSLIPQLRLRYPFFDDKLVPYLIGGFGGSFCQFNDRQWGGFNRNIEADSYGWAATVGFGVDYFVADNIALTLEVKQIWHSSRDITVDNHTFAYDPSGLAATVGLRVFFEENHPKPLVGESEGNPTRLFLGLRAGGAVITDDNWGNGVSWEHEAKSWGGWFLHQVGGSVGADFGRYWGVELTASGGQPNIQVDGVGVVTEYALASIIPQIRLRLPISEGRWVPYALAGAGVCYGEVNDDKPPSLGHTVVGEGIYPAFAVGGGIERFIARNVSFSAEARWMYSWNHKFTFDGHETLGDYSHLEVMLALRLYLKEF